MSGCDLGSYEYNRILADMMYRGGNIIVIDLFVLPHFVIISGLIEAKLWDINFCCSLE